MVFTPIEQIGQIREEARAGFASGRTKDLNYRKRQLLQLAYLLQDNLDRFEHALRADLGRPPHETLLLEVSTVRKEALVARSMLKSWAKTRSAPLEINTFLMRGRVTKEPKGTVLIIGPFNYPIWCLLTPLVGAIAAGCAAVIKPSEICPATMNLIVDLIPKYLDNELYKVVAAEIPGTTKLLSLQWDHIVYTGNGNVGRIVATAAAKHLTPVTLELGGKSPAIVDDTADLQLAAKRILWAKMVNAGQTCVAPDYVLVSHRLQDALVEALLEAHNTFYGSTPEQVYASEDFSRIVADRHFDRLKRLVEDTQGEIVIGGQSQRETRYIAPTIIKNVTDEDSLMREELFGPLLPIVPVDNLDAMIEFVNMHDTPLAAYHFSSNGANKKRVEKSTRSGMFMTNECIIGANIQYGFGGAGPSGYGAHSFKAGFDTFTLERPVMDNPKLLEIIMQFRYPPYTNKKRSVMSFFVFRKIFASRPTVDHQYGAEKEEEPRPSMSPFAGAGGKSASRTKQSGEMQRQQQRQQRQQQQQATFPMSTKQREQYGGQQQQSQAPYAPSANGNGQQVYYVPPNANGNGNGQTSPSWGRI